MFTTPWQRVVHLLTWAIVLPFSTSPRVRVAAVHVEDQPGGGRGAGRPGGEELWPHPQPDRKLLCSGPHLCPASYFLHSSL